MMTCMKEDRAIIVLGGEEMKRVDSFEYLVSELQEDGRLAMKMREGVRQECS